MDMLVKLYALPSSRDAFERLESDGITTRRALCGSNTRSCSCCDRRANSGTISAPA